MHTFHWSDYAVFGALLLFYAFVGLFLKFKYDAAFSRSKVVIREYFLASRTMGVLPVAASILVSFMSAISILGTVAEVYVSGIEYAVIGFSYFVAFPVAAFVYFPTFYRLNVTSVHEYLQLRFSRLVRVIVSLIFVVQMLFYISVVLYAPALAFSQVSGLSLWISILSIGIVCTFYTAMGGMRAVIWTDLIQFFIMMIGILSVVIIGITRVGSFTKIWDLSLEGGRINLFNFDFNPLTRHSFWSLFIGGIGMCLSIYATNQAQVQRYLSCRTEKTAIRSLIINVPLTFAFLWMMIIAGLVIFASFAYCDPINSNKITKSDQIFPFFVMELLHQYSPLPGFFLSSIFAAGLSTLSSGINSLCNVLMEDLIKMCRSETSDTAFKPGRTSLYVRLIAVFLGVITIVFAFLFSLVSPTVLQIALSLFGMAGGPILSVFSMGLLVPCINEKGAAVGLVGSLIVTMWIGVGSIYLGSATSKNLFRNTTGCTNLTFVPVFIPPKEPTYSIYNLSYLYYTWVALIVCSILSFSVSAITGFNNKNKIPKKYFFSLIPKLSEYWPAIFPCQICYDEKIEESTRL